MLLRLSYMVHVAVHVNAIEVELYGACGGSCECY